MKRNIVTKLLAINKSKLLFLILFNLFPLLVRGDVSDALDEVFKDLWKLIKDIFFAILGLSILVYLLSKLLAQVKLSDWVKIIILTYCFYNFGLFYSSFKPKFSNQPPNYEINQGSNSNIVTITPESKPNIKSKLTQFRGKEFLLFGNYWILVTFAVAGIIFVD